MICSGLVKVCKVNVYCCESSWVKVDVESDGERETRENRERCVVETEG